MIYATETPIEDKGRGLITTKNILPGEIVLTDTPLITGSNEVDLLYNALISKEYYDIFDDLCHLNYSDLDITEQLRISDIVNAASEMYELLVPIDTQSYDNISLVAWRIALRFECNSFNLWDTNYQRRAMGVYRYASRFNHSCIPNLVREQRGDTLVFSAIENIQAHQELTFSYIPVTYSRDIRSDMLMRYFQFDCSCQRCKGNIKIDIELGKTLGHDTCGGTWNSEGHCAICELKRNYL